MRKEIHKETVEKLFEAVLSLKNMEECYMFFEDVCTINELNSLAQRFDVGSRLLESCARSGVALRGVRLLDLGDGVVCHGKVEQLYHQLRLDAEGIAAAVKEIMDEKDPA